MKKILIIITTGFVSYGGLTTVMMNYYRVMNKDGLQIDFASCNELSDDALIKELESNGSHYYCLGNRKKNLFQYVQNLRRILKDGKYNIVHVNGNSATMVLELIIARLNKVPSRIAHGHNTKSSYPFLHNILHPIFKNQYTSAIAVSKGVGEWLFGDNFFVLNNAIDTDKYKYSKETRVEYRKKFNLEDKIIIGTVGKLNLQKNHEYLLKIFKEYKKYSNSAVLMIVGDGSCRSILEKQCKNLNIENDVFFLGMRSDVNQILQMFDIFVFPSKFEGLGMALIEAQASGLSCIASDRVPKETNVTENVEYLPIVSDVNEWTEALARLLAINKLRDRMQKSEDACRNIRERGYYIDAEANRLRKIYDAVSLSGK